MTKYFKNINGNKRLGVIAFVLGFLAIVLGNPYNNTYTKVNVKDLTLATLNGSDLISVSQLADELMKGYSGFRVIDLRPEEEYQKYFIPGSENIPVAQLTESGLMRNEKIILYDEDNLTSSQAWFLLKSMDFKGIYILKGGLKEWKDKILFPKLSSNASPEETEAFAKVSEISKYFGGVPQTGGEAMSTQSVELPTVQAPTAPAGMGTKNKKKREGC